VPVGHLANGLGLYRLCYDDSDKLFVGVIAQEVERVMPDAVRPRAERLPAGELRARRRADDDLGGVGRGRAAALRFARASAQRSGGEPLASG
jgi:hypothetical protein